MKRVKLRQDQSGLAAIIVTMIIMLVLTLIVMSFARVVQREQRQVADRQLSTQAFYAAESGLNYAARTLVSNPAATKTGCGPSSPFSDAGHVGDNVSFTCLLVSAPTSLVFDNISLEDDLVIPLKRPSGSLNAVEFKWQSTVAGATDTSGCLARGQYESNLIANCQVGMLRVDLVPTSAGLSRSNLMSGAITIFMQPGTLASTEGTSVRRATGQCSSGVCSLTISGLSQTEYHARIRSIYRTSKLEITPSPSGTLIGAQAIVDSTGRAADVLRRIQARVPISSLSSQLFPSNGMESGGSICKRLSIVRASPPALIIEGAGDPACNP